MATRLIAIDSDIMSNPKLDLLDKLLLGYVSDWESKGSVCFAKDRFFTQLFGVGESEIMISLYKLEGLGFIEQFSGNGGRLIKTKKSQITPTPYQDLDIFQL